MLRSLLVPNALVRAAAWTPGVLWLLILFGLPAYSKPREQPVPALHDFHRPGLAGRVEGIDPVPSLQRRPPVQILMRPQRVVPGAEFGQESVQRCALGEDALPQLVLQRPKEALDAPVLPGAMQIDALVANAQQSQARAEHPAGETALVAGTHEARPTELGDSQTQLPQQRPAALASQPNQPQRPAAVIQHAQVM